MNRYQNPTKESGRSMAPIFGCRKRSRQAVFSDPIDLPAHEDDDGPFINFKSQQMNTNSLSENHPRKVMRRQNYNQQSSNKENYYQQDFNSMKLTKPGVNMNDPELIVIDDDRQHYSSTNVDRSISTIGSAHEDNKNVTTKSHTNNKDSTNKMINSFNIRIITSTINDLYEWSTIQETVPRYYELTGILDSTIPFNNPNPQKAFTLKDKTGSIRCMFWEIDRSLPRITRQSKIRVLGRFIDGYVHCLSLRCVQNDELQVLEKLLTVCKNMQDKKQLLAREM